MSNEAVVLSNRARRLAVAKGFGEHADDFAQDAYIKLSQGRKAQLRLLFVDFMRENFGDDRRPNSMINCTEYHSELPEKETEELSAEDQLQWDSLLKRMDPQERSLIVLFFQWGLTLKEIGYTTGVSESRVSQQITAIMKNLKKRFK